MEEKNCYNIQGQNHLKQFRDGILQWEAVIADILATFENKLLFDDFANIHWIRWQWVEMCVKRCAIEVQKSKKKGRQVNKQLVTNLGEQMGKKAWSKPPESPNKTFMVLIYFVSNGIVNLKSPILLQASYTDVSHWEGLSDWIHNNGGPQLPLILISIFMQTVEQGEFDTEYMKSYSQQEKMNNPIYRQTSHKCYLINAVKCGQISSLYVSKWMLLMIELTSS